MKATQSFYRIFLIVGLLFGSSAVFATTIPLPSVVGGSGVILMVDGPDRGASVAIDFGFTGRNRMGLEFGFMSGDLFNVLGAGRGYQGSRSFAGGAVVDFAVRSKGSDGRFGTTDDGIFRLSDAVYASEYFSDPVKGPKSRNPRVTGTYYETLRLAWDINRDGIMDLTVMLNTRNYNGMRSVPSAVPVPVPAAVWLLGSGLVGLASVARRNGPSESKGRCGSRGQNGSGRNYDNDVVGGPWSSMAVFSRFPFFLRS